MTRNGHVRRIGYLRDDRNRIEQRMRRGDLASSDPAWKTANDRLLNAVMAALKAGVPSERIRAITWRESPVR